MKLLNMTTAYPAYLKKFFSARPGLTDKPYAEQKAALDYDVHGWSDSWSHALAPLGYEVVEITSNAKSIQTAWATEHGLKYNEENWIIEIAEAQLLHESPDILFLTDYATFSQHWVRAMRKACPSIKLVLGWCGAPVPDETVFKDHDLLLSCVPEYTQRFREMGHRSYHIDRSFDTRILDRIDMEREPSIDFSFIGSIFRGNQFHLEREKLLKQFVRLGDIDIFSQGGDVTFTDELMTGLARVLYDGVSSLRSIGVPDKVLKSLPVIGRVATWKNKPFTLVAPELKPYMKPSVFGLDMFQALRDSKVTFNSHIDISPKSASNMRLFEATGVGTCLLTDWKENLNEIFEIDKEVVAFRSIDECVEKVEWLLAHPEERKEIARAGQERCLREYTFLHRGVRLDQIIKKELARKTAGL